MPTKASNGGACLDEFYQNVPLVKNGKIRKISSKQVQPMYMAEVYTRE